MLQQYFGKHSDLAAPDEAALAAEERITDEAAIVYFNSTSETITDEAAIACFNSTFGTMAILSSMTCRANACSIADEAALASFRRNT